MVAAGLARYGLKDQVLQIMRGQFEASRHMDLHRLPELFCGFARVADEPPTLYPVACSPQAWAAAAVFMLLQSCLGLTVSAVEQRLTFAHPVLPNFLERLHIRNLTAGESSLDLLLLRHDSDVGINIIRRTGPVEICSVK
jgi:glycogen debranching enzyme